MLENLPENLGLIVCGVVLAIALLVALVRGGRIKAKFGKGSLDAGGGTRLENISAGRDLHAEAEGDAVMIKELRAGRDVTLKARQSSES